MITEKLLSEFNSVILGSSTSKPSLGSVLSAVDYYETNEEKIASIILGIIKNHPFLDGNKRTATITLFHLSEENNIKLVNDTKLFSAIVRIAANKLSVEEIVKLVFKT